MSEPVFILLGQERPNLSVEEIGTVESPATGRQLRRVQVSTGSISASLHERLQQELSTEDGEAVVADTAGGRWRVSNRSYHTQRGAGVFEHYVDLEEIETISLDSIEFAGFRLHPDQFAVDPSDDRLVLEVMIDVALDKSEAIEQALATASNDSDLYFPVTLEGLRNEPIRMRFGRCLWREIGDSKRRHRLVFVSESGDKTDSPFHRLHEPEVSRLIGEALESAARFEQLLTELQAAGVLAGDAVQRIRSARPRSGAERLFDRDDKLDNLD